MWAAEMNTNEKPNIFGHFRYLVKFSPFNCGFKLFIVPTLAIFFAMGFRVYWLMSHTTTPNLTLGWAERNIYVFITFETIACIVALYNMTRVGSIDNLEKNIGAMKSLRNVKHNDNDNYKKLHIKLSLLTLPVLGSFVSASVFLITYKITLFGSHTNDSWFYILNTVITILCGYINFIYLPIHCLLHSAIRREFDIFNDELNESSKNKQLGNIDILQTFSQRHLKLTEFTNFMSTRLSVFMQFAPFSALTALLNATYYVTNFGGQTPIPYFIPMVFISISTLIISALLTYPLALIQDSMSKTSQILLSDTSIPSAVDPRIYTTYRTMVDRSLHNRQPVHVIYVFAVTRKNIERTLFIISNVVVVMSIVNSFVNKST